MCEIPLRLLEVKHSVWHSAAFPNKPLTGWTHACFLVLLICDFLEFSLCATVAGSRAEHEGFCPNKLNSNLWVDAQSTCERECSVDEVR